MADSMRSLSCFGVAGLLSTSAEILYSNDLRARNVGRVSDLLAAKLREKKVDEMRFRTLLTYGLFLVYAVRGHANRHSEEMSPVSAEIGYDENYLAIGVSFHWEGSRAPKFNGLLERLEGDSPGDNFEKILARMESIGTQLFVRYEVKERRLEVVALINQHDSGLKDPTMLIAVDSKKAPLMEVASYTELGDLDYAKLLKVPTASELQNRETEAGTTETKVDGRTPQDTLEEFSFSGTAQPQEEVMLVGDLPQETDGEFKFSGNSSPSEADELRALLAENEREMNAMRETIQELERQLSDSPVSEGDVQVIKATPSENKKEDDWGIHFLKQAWPFAKKEEPETTVVKGAKAEPEYEETTVVSGNAESGDESSESVEGIPEGLDALREIQALAKQKKSKKFEQTLAEISEEVEEAKSKKWVDNLSSELLQEKARLNELQKNLSKQIRQRELEFKTAEGALKQELKRKEDILRQKQAALEKKNDQIAQLNLAVERAGNASADKEQQQLKVRLDRAMKISQMKEEEAKSLIAKVRDLENRLIIAQAKSQKTNDLGTQVKVQTLEKKVDEYKRVNQRLMESLNSQKDRTSDKEIGDLRRKIDQLDRQLTESKRNFEKSQFKIRELQESERKMQMDMARAVEENRNLRKNQSRGSGGDTGGQAA